MPSAQVAWGAYLLSWAQIVRLPALFAGPADITLGYLGARYLTQEPTEPIKGAALGAVCISSICLHAAGMIWNDFFDRAEDACTRPYRPLPSGRITVRSALSAGVLLLAIGLLAALLAGFLSQRSAPAQIGTLLAMGAFAYNALIKTTPLGPPVMGLCRWLNVLLGASLLTAADPSVFVLATNIGLYVTGITWAARYEVGPVRRGTLIGSGSLILFPGLAHLYVVGEDLWTGLSQGHFWDRSGADVLQNLLQLLITMLWTSHLAYYWWRAWRSACPDQVRRLVTVALRGSIVLSALLTALIVGPAGWLVLLLLPPAIVTGRWLYTS